MSICDQYDRNGREGVIFLHIFAFFIHLTISMVAIPTTLVTLIHNRISAEIRIDLYVHTTKICLSVINNVEKQKGGPFDAPHSPNGLW